MHHNEMEWNVKQLNAMQCNVYTYLSILFILSVLFILPNLSNLSNVL